MSDNLFSQLISDLAESTATRLQLEQELESAILQVAELFSGHHPQQLGDAKITFEFLEEGSVTIYFNRNQPPFNTTTFLPAQENWETPGNIIKRKRYLHHLSDEQLVELIVALHLGLTEFNRRRQQLFDPGSQATTILKATLIKPALPKPIS